MLAMALKLRKINQSNTGHSEEVMANEVFYMESFLESAFCKNNGQCSSGNR